MAAEHPEQITKNNSVILRGSRCYIFLLSSHGSAHLCVLCHHDNESFTGSLCADWLVLK